MTTPIIANLEKLIGGPRDGALLRYSLGNELFKAGDLAGAIARLREALERDAHYSAAWKLLGKALAADGQAAEAADVYRRGIAIADARGDIQAEKEMTVFLKRLTRGAPGKAPPGGCSAT